MMNVLPESIHTHIIRRITTVKRYLLKDTYKICQLGINYCPVYKSHYSI